MSIKIRCLSIVAVTLFLGACGSDTLECHSLPVNWQDVIVTTGPLPEYEAAMATVGDTLSLADFKSIWQRYDERGHELLESVGRADNKLAETLFLFHTRLNSGENPDEVLKDAFTHYVINSDGQAGVGMMASPGPRRLAESYARTLCIPMDEEFLPDVSEDSLVGLREAGIKMNGIRYGRADVLPTNLFQFEYGRADYHTGNAVWMAEMAALAYHDRNVVEAQLQQWGYSRDFEWIEGEATGTQGFVVANKQHVIVAFRGTSNINDLKVNLSTLRKREENSTGSVHSGFQSALNDVWNDQVKPAIARMRGDRHVYLVGHSLGAALAQLTAYRLVKGDQIPVTAVYTFGSPLIGDVKFTQDYDTLLATRTHSHINNEDLVTSIPPSWLGFRRLGMDFTRKFIGTRHELTLMNNLPRNHWEQYEIGNPGLESDDSIVLNSTDELEMRNEYENVGKQLEHSNGYLKDQTAGESAPPLVVYGASFEDGHLDDHGIYEYLFKLSCANVEEFAEQAGINADDLGRKTAR